jgi:hypothetical protein
MTTKMTTQLTIQTQHKMITQMVFQMTTPDDNTVNQLTDWGCHLRLISGLSSGVATWCCHPMLSFGLSYGLSSGLSFGLSTDDVIWVVIWCCHPLLYVPKPKRWHYSNMVSAPASPSKIDTAVYVRFRNNWALLWSKKYQDMFLCIRKFKNVKTSCCITLPFCP